MSLIASSRSNPNAIVIVSILNLMAPISGLLMEMFLAWGYGASSSIDAFRISSLIMGFGAQFLSVYLLPHLLIPAFSEYKTRSEERRWWSLCWTVLIIVSFGATIFIVCIFMNPSYIVNLLGPGLRGTDGHEDAQLLVKYFSIILILMAWCGVLVSILNSYRIFWISPLIQTIPNIAVISLIAFNINNLDIEILGIGTLIGYMIITICFLYSVYKVAKNNGIDLYQDIKISKISEILVLTKKAIPLILVIAIGQWGVIEINKSLSELSGGTLSNFGFAWKLLAIVSIIPLGMGVVLFPAFSEDYSTKEISRLRNMTKSAFRMTVYLTIPLVIFLFIEKNEIILLLFGSKKMSIEAIDETAIIFGLLVIGAPASATSITLSKIAVVMNDKFTLIGIAVLASLITGIIASTIGKTWGVFGLSIMCSLLAWISLFIQIAYQSKKYKIINLKKSINYLGQVGIISFLSGVILMLLSNFNNTSPILALSINTFIYFIAISSISIIFKNEEFIKIIYLLNRIIYKNAK